MNFNDNNEYGITITKISSVIRNDDTYIFYNYTVSQNYEIINVG